MQNIAQLHSLRIFHGCTNTHCKKIIRTCVTLIQTCCLWTNLLWSTAAKSALKPNICSAWSSSCFQHQNPILYALWVVPSTHLLGQHRCLRNAWGLFRRRCCRRELDIRFKRCPLRYRGCLVYCTRSNRWDGSHDGCQHRRTLGRVLHGDRHTFFYLQSSKSEYFVFPNQ